MSVSGKMRVGLIRCTVRYDNISFIIKTPYMYIVTSPLHESRLLWIHDPYPNQPSRVAPRKPAPKKNNDTVPRNNHHTVPRNTNTVNKSDAHARAPLDTIPSAPSPRKNVCEPVPRNNITQTHSEANSSSLPPKRKRDRKHRRERRAREEKIIVSHLFMMRAGPISVH